MAKKEKRETFRGCVLKVPEGDEPILHRAMEVLPPGFVSVLVDKRWPGGRVELSVQFLDNPQPTLRARILGHMNAWGEYASVKFRETSGAGQVRISRGRGGYWSYLGTDALRIPAGQPTLNLEGFTQSTPESEFRRVVRHEAGHALGCPHEHARREIVERLDPRKVVAYFRRTQGWSEQVTRQQVLTPLEEGSILGTATADETSIMAYAFPGSVTRDGRPIPGGSDITRADAEFLGRVYPLAPAPPAAGAPAVLVALDADGREVARYEPRREA